MGCKVSKVEDLPLVVICKKRKDLIRAAADRRYALALAHISYFSSLREVGDALHRFVDEDLLLVSASSSPSSLSSPVLTLPSDDDDGSRKQRRRKPAGSKNDYLSSSTSISHSVSNSNAMNRNRKPNRKGKAEFRYDEEEADDSEIYFSSLHSKGSSSSGHIHHKKRRSPKPGITYSPTIPMMNYTHYYNPDYLHGNPYTAYDSSDVYYPTGNSYGVYYMKKDSARIPSVIYQEPEPAPIYSYSDFGNGGEFGFEFVTVPLEQGGRNKQEKQQKKNPVAPTPPSPKVSAWDYFNPFENIDDNGYSGYFVSGAFGDDSDKGSSDSREVREREGIPELEEESDIELIKQTHAEKNKKKKKKKKNAAEDFSNNRNRNVHFDERGANNFVDGNFNEVPLHPWQQMPKPLEPKPQKHKQMDAEKESPVLMKEMTSSSLSDISIPVSVEELLMKGGDVNFKMDEPSQHDVESSKLSSLTTLSAHGTRDLREVVGEIKDEFEAAIDYGNQVCHLLEAGKLPYQSKSTFFNAMLSHMPCPVEESVSATQPQPRLSVSSEASKSRMRKAHFEDNMDSLGASLVSTLDKLYVWEKKLYKEVKDEEKLRIMYESKCRKLKHLDSQGADASKIEATEEFIKQLSTRISMSIKTVHAIAHRIHQIRDQELQPQLKQLILGLRRMWKLMLKCHKKQLHAIIQSKITKLRGNMGSYRDSSARATAQLEMEILNWCNRFNEWIELQKSYVKSLNAWLLSYLTSEPVQTADGPAPYSPGQLGVPSVFVMCHDWMQAMKRITQSGVSETVKTAMNDFASTLHELLEKQEEEQCRRQLAEHTLKDFERQINNLRINDASSDKDSSLSLVPSDLESAKRKVKAERSGHKEAIKLVHAAASKSIKAGFIPIFEALESFTAQAVKAYDDVRLNE